jgi:hypothetical protein
VGEGEFNVQANPGSDGHNGTRISQQVTCDGRFSFQELEVRQDGWVGKVVGFTYFDAHCFYVFVSCRKWGDAVLGQDSLELRGKGSGSEFSWGEFVWRRRRRREDAFFDCPICVLNCVDVFERGGVRDATVPKNSDGGRVSS